MPGLRTPDPHLRASRGYIAGVPRSPPATVHPAAVRRLAGMLVELGLSPPVLFAEHGLAVDAVALEERVDRERFLAVKAAAARALADPWLGLRLGLTAHPSALDLYGAVISHARTVGEAVRLGLEYAPLWEQGPEMRVTTTDECLAISYLNPPHPDPLANTIDSQESVVFLTALCHNLVGRAAIRMRACFACPRPPRGRHLERVRRLGCEPRFGGDEWRFELPHALLECPLPPANPAVARLVRTHVDEQMHTFSATDLPTLVERAIRRGLAQGWGVVQVARALAMSPRTLQQGLTARGTSFSAELRRVRLAFAHDMLGRSEHSVAAVARALGFSSLSSFSRFFREATGSSPQAHRRGAREGPRAHGQTSARKSDTSS